MITSAGRREAVGWTADVRGASRNDGVGLAFPDEGVVFGAMKNLDKIRVEKEINEKGEKEQRYVYSLYEGCACFRAGLSTYTSGSVLGVVRMNEPAKEGKRSRDFIPKGIITRRPKKDWLNKIK